MSPAVPSRWRAIGEGLRGLTPGYFRWLAMVGVLVCAGMIFLHTIPALRQEQGWAEVSGQTPPAMRELNLLLWLALLFSGGCAGLELRQRSLLRWLRHTSRNLATSEERFRLAYDEAAVGMFMLDLTGRVIAANRAITEITGYGKAEIIGRHVADFLGGGKI